VLKWEQVVFYKALFIKFVDSVSKKSAFGFFTAFLHVLYKEEINLFHGERARRKVILRVYVGCTKATMYAKTAFYIW